MRINPNIAAQAIKRYGYSIHEDEQTSHRIITNDRVELSERSKTYSDLMGEVKNIDDVDEDKVNDIINRLAAGTYQVDLGSLAESILNQGY